MCRCFWMMLVVFTLSGIYQLSAQEDISPGYRLLYAADSGQIQNVRIALLEDAPVDFRTPDGVTALMYASAAGYLDVVSLLIQMGADVNAEPYDSRRTALVAAVENGHVEVAELLIRSGAEMTYVNEYGTSLLHIAAGSWVWEMVDLLIYYGFPVEIIDEDKKTPLFYAAFYGFDANIRVLLGNGANINSRDEDGNTALHIAALQGHLKSAKELAEQGLDVNLQNKKGFSSLDLAAMKGNDSVVQYLVSHDALINDSIRRGYNTLTLARKSGNKELVSYLKQQGAKPDYSPYFNSIDLGMFVSTNFDDTFMGAIFGVHEDKINLDVDFKIGGRINNYQMLYRKEPGYYEYYWEDRYIAGLGIVKSFDILKPSSGWRLGVDAGIFQNVSWSKITGLSHRPAPDFLQTYRVGLSAKYEIIRFGIHYDYMKFPILDYRAGRMNFELKLYLRFKNDLYYNVLI